jgi:hypothetical protein
VSGIAVEFGTLCRTYGVLDREVVQTELIGELLENVPAGLKEIHPDDRVRLPDVIRDRGQGKPLSIEQPIAVDACQNLTHG